MKLEDFTPSEAASAEIASYDDDRQKSMRAVQSLAAEAEKLKELKESRVCQN